VGVVDSISVCGLREDARPGAGLSIKTCDEALEGADVWTKTITNGPREPGRVGQRGERVYEINTTNIKRN